MNNMSQDVVIYNTKDIQRILKCGQRQAYELMNSPVFPSIQINSKHIITKAKFEEWLELNSGKKVIL